MYTGALSIRLRGVGLTRRGDFPHFNILIVFAGGFAVEAYIYIYNSQFVCATVLTTPGRDEVVANACKEKLGKKLSETEDVVLI
jgi:hypothetical protein